MTYKCPDCGSESISKEYINGKKTDDRICGDCGNTDISYNFGKGLQKNISVYDAWYRAKNFNERFDKKLNAFIHRNNLILDIEEANRHGAMLSTFKQWAKSQQALGYSDLWDAMDKFLELNKDNDVYFSKQQENIVKRACKELGITQKELADKLGVDDGTVRKWASEATKTPEWAEKFISLIIEHEKNVKAISSFKYFLDSVGVGKTNS